MASLFNPKLEICEVSDELPGYTNIEEFTEGGQGCIFRALSSDRSVVAIKIYAPGQTLVRAELEVQKLQRMSSVYMVQLFQSGYVKIRGQDSFYSITRWEEGEDLRRRLSDHGTLTDFEVRLLLTHICTAIDELWHAKVVHCDVKPENILFGADGAFRLVDLGLAKHLDNPTITQFGITMGTLGYMAPEQMTGRKNYTLRVDLFALGICAYESLTGIHPFGKNQFLVMSNVSVEPPSNSIQIGSDLEKAIMKMLQHNPLYRPTSGADVITMIRG